MLPLSSNHNSNHIAIKTGNGASHKHAHAVNGVFAISGFLVTMSFERRGWRDYAVARCLRIAPALIVATLVTAFVIGAPLTRLPLAAYYADPALWRFVIATPTTFKSAT